MALLFAPLRAPAASTDAKFTGPGSCSSSSCHGGIEPRSDNSVAQNEYTTWAVQDKHAHAFAALGSETGRSMGRILKIQPEKTARCLACHALDVPEEQRARSFDSNDGVSCENCHGAASNWLGPHTTRGWNYAKSVELGLYDTRDLIKRSEKCLGCHLGDSLRSVDHELIAAGHPDLYFELDSFSAVQPRHWREPVSADPGITVRTLAVGQAVQLREHLRRVSRDAARGWPEYSDLDCFACHHSIGAPNASWRQQRGYAGRRPGDPPWNTSRFAVLRIIAAQLDPSREQHLSAAVERVSALATDQRSNRAQIGAAADQAALEADRVAHTVQSMPLDAASALRLMHAIANDAERIAGQGERAAEQAVMALDSLFLAYGGQSAPQRQAEIKAGITALFSQLEHPSAYAPEPFARQLRAVDALLPR